MEDSIYDKKMFEPTFHQVPYTSLLARIDSGSQCLFELSSHMIERRELEEKNIMYSTKISRSNTYQYEIQDSSTERILGYFKNYHLFISKAQVKQHKEFGDILINELDDLKVSRSSCINKNKVLVQNCQREVTLAEEALEKTKIKLAKATTDYEKAKEKLAGLEIQVIEANRLLEEKKKENSGKEVNKSLVNRILTSAFETTPEMERDRQLKKLERKHIELIQCKNQIIEKKRDLMDKISSVDSAIEKATEAFQQVETERLRKIKSCLKSFCDIERDAIKARSDLLKNLEEAIDLQSSDNDISLFINKEKQLELTHKYSNALYLMDLQMQERKNTQPVDDVVLSVNTVIGKNEDSSLTNMIDTSVLSGSDNSDEADKMIDDSNELLLSIPSSNDDADCIEILNNALISLFPLKLETDKKEIEITNEKDLNDIYNKLDANIELSVDQWNGIFKSKEARTLFLQELDEQRGKWSLLNGSAYYSMANAMKSILDYCDGSSDVKNAMRIVNMANTFHKIDKTSDNESVAVDTERKSLSTDLSMIGKKQINNLLSSLLSEEKVFETDFPLEIINESVLESNNTKGFTEELSTIKRKYLHSEVSLKSHPMWRRKGFWESALLDGVISQILNSDSDLTWDALSPDQLREAVIGIHNIAFGQLGSLLFVMHEFGLSCEEVEENIRNMCEQSQLTEDQKFELLKSVKKLYGKYIPLTPVNTKSNLIEKPKEKEIDIIKFPSVLKKDFDEAKHEKYLKKDTDEAKNEKEVKVVEQNKKSTILNEITSNTTESESKSINDNLTEDNEIINTESDIITKSSSNEPVTPASTRRNYINYFINRTTTPKKPKDSSSKKNKVIEKSSPPSSQHIELLSGVLPPSGDIELSTGTVVSHESDKDNQDDFYAVL